jgi:hypothetical protein
MAAPMVSGAAAALLEGSPTLTWTQTKLVLQGGATYVRDAGLMGAGAGSLDIWASRSLAASGLSRLEGIDGATPAGASFWDAGTLSAALYAGAGARLLSALDLTAVWTERTMPRFGNLNLMSLLSPLAAIPPNRLIWGDNISGSTEAPTITWGSTFSDSSGNQIIWGSTDDDQIIWGSTDTEPNWGSATLTSQNVR